MPQTNAARPRVNKPGVPKRTWEETCASQSGAPAKFDKDKYSTWEKGRKKQDMVLAERWRVINAAVKKEKRAEREAEKKAKEAAEAAELAKKQARRAAKKPRPPLHLRRKGCPEHVSEGGGGG